MRNFKDQAPGPGPIRPFSAPSCLEHCTARGWSGCGYTDPRAPNHPLSLQETSHNLNTELEVWGGCEALRSGEWREIPKTPSLLMEKSFHLPLRTPSIPDRSWGHDHCSPVLSLALMKRYSGLPPHLSPTRVTGSGAAGMQHSWLCVVSQAGAEGGQREGTVIQRGRGRTIYSLAGASPQTLQQHLGPSPDTTRELGSKIETGDCPTAWPHSHICQKTAHLWKD